MTRIGNSDIILIGSGIMSANPGALLKNLDPALSIHVYAGTDGLEAGELGRLEQCPDNIAC